MDLVDLLSFLFLGSIPILRQRSRLEYLGAYT
jgi:hypothetical protein